MFKKAVLINISEAALDQSIWRQLDEVVETKVLIGRDDPKLFEELKDADCLLIGYQVPTQKDVIDVAPNLKYIGILATAFGTVDLEYAASKGIVVSNLGAYSGEAVAEFTLAILLWKMRNIEEGLKRAAEGKFDETGMTARELKGAQFGVIGLGTIGRRVAEIATGFGAQVGYWSREKKDVPYAYMKLDDLLSSSEYISINVAESEETKGLLNAERIAKLKDDATIVTTVPLSVIDMDAMLERVKASNIVFISDHGEDLSSEQLDAWSKLSDRVTFLPAIAYITQEARIAKQEIFIENMRGAISGEPLNRVN